MPGPHEQRLIQALHGGDGGRSFSQGREWSGMGKLLKQVANALDSSEPPAHGGEAGALTAEAMSAAFTKSAQAMHQRADHVSLGEEALLVAGTALHDADAEYQALGPEGSAPTYTPHEDPGSEEGIKARNDYLAQQQAFAAEQAKREEAARIAADKLEERLHKAADVMAGLHDQTVDDGGGTGGGGNYPAGSASGGGGAASGGGRATGGGAGISGNPVWDDFGGRDPGGGNGGRDPGGTNIDYVPGQPNPNAGGTPATIGGPTVPVAGVGSGGADGGGLPIGPAGVVAGGAAAGVIGAKLSGALRGVLAGGAGSAGTGAAGVAGRSGTAASGVRGIGATAKSAGASTLGRSATSAAAGRGAGGGTAGRTGSAGNGAGRAGSRAGAPGAGRGGGRRGKGEDGLDHERFDVGEDWTGDDDAGPGVLA